MIQDNEEHTLEDAQATLRLADIQRRCSQLLKNPDGFDGLALEDPPQGMDQTNPYDRG